MCNSIRRNQANAGAIVSDKNPQIEASFVIPVYNEEAIITSAINDLVVNLADALPELRYEIIVTENGSVDDTLELAYALERKYPQVRALHSPEPN